MMDKTIIKKIDNIDFNDIIQSDDFFSLIEELKKLIIENISLRKESVNIIIDDEEYELSLGNYLTLLILAIPFHNYNKEFISDLLIDPSDINNIEDYLDNIIHYFQDKFGISINNDIIDIIDHLTLISGEINVKYGNSISLKSIIDLAERNKRFKEIINMTISKNEKIEVDEIMKRTNDALNEMIDIIKEDKNNILYNYIESDSGINKKQLGQVLSYIALKPDFNENIIEVPINTSFARGLKTVKEYFINAIGARKALITSRHQVKSAGYLTRKLSLLMMDLYIDDCEDCHTKHLMEIEVKDKKTLKLLNERWYRLNEDDEEEFLINKDDDDIIGKTIFVRSPITCACNDGAVCKKCYGNLYKTNQDMNIGIIATLLLTNPLTQRLLSSKHLLQANISSIDWNKEFINNFDIIRNKVYFKNDKTKIIINEDDIIFDEDSNDEMLITRISIANDKKVIDIDLPIPFSFNNEINNEEINKFYDHESGTYIIQNKNLKDYEEDYVFHFTVENNGLSSSLLAIKALIEKNGYISDHTINETYNRFVELINESGIYIMYIHIELILRQMMSLYDNDGNITFDRSLFLEDTFPNYKLYNISDAIQYGPSIGKALVFEQLFKQLMTDSYNSLEKEGHSIIDDLL